MSKTKADMYPEESTSGSPSSARPARRLRIITREDIAQRAYSFYLARHSEDGHDVEDWLRAERELLENVSNDEDFEPS